MSACRPRKTLFKLILAGTALVVAILIGEILLTQVIGVDSGHHPRRFIRLRERPPLRIAEWESDADFLTKTDGIERNEFRLESDADGNVLPAFHSEHPEHRILFLGGSTTECENVGETNRFPYLVGQLLQDGGVNVSTINSASIGNHAMHSLNILLNRGLDYSPDIVIMMHNINDLATLRLEGSYYNDHPTRSLILTAETGFGHHAKGLLKSTIPGLYHTLRNTIQSFRGNQDEFKNRRRQRFAIDKLSIRDQFRRSLLMFIGICQANGILPVLMTQANRFKPSPDPIVEKDWGPNGAQGAGYRSFIDIYHSMNDDIRRICHDNHVPCIDLAEAIPQERSHLYDSVHLNDTGSKLAASVITSEIESIIRSNPPSTQP